MQPEHVPVTRRELRAAAAAQQHRAHRRALLPTAPGGSRTAARAVATLDGLRLSARLASVTRPRADHLLGGLRALVARPGCVVLLSAAFLAGGITQVSAEQAARDEHRAAMTAAQAEADRAAAAHERRVTEATAHRMTEQGVAYAAHRRNEALATAQAAIDAAGAVVVAATPVVAAEQISPLDVARAQLAELVAAAPASRDVIVPPPTLGTRAMAATHDGAAPTPVVAAPSAPT
ncbi:hypothetical protein ICW40_17015, partial [Actinotalea ferrariae]|nr:hypothetical protein [Actinotalea ferrariae]